MKAGQCAGSEYDDLDPEARRAAARDLIVFSRVEPSHKTRLVEALKAQVLLLAPFRSNIVGTERLLQKPFLKRPYALVLLFTAAQTASDDLRTPSNGFELVLAALMTI